MNYLQKLLFSLLLPSLLWGCDSMKPKDSRDIGTKTQEQLEYLEEFKNNVPTVSTDIQNEEGIQLGLLPVPITNSEKLPSNLLGDNALVWRSNQRINLYSILARLSALTGIQHYLFIGPENKLVTIDEGGDYPTQELLAKYGLNSSIRPDFGGSLPQVLNEISSIYNLEWIYENGSINLRQFSLKSYSLDLLPTKTLSSSTIGSTTTSINMDLLSEIQTSMQNLLGNDEELVAEAGTGTLLLNARPSTHGRVAKYIKQINAGLGQQIAIDVTVLTLSLEESQGFSTAFNFAGGTASGNTFDLVETGSLTGASTLANVGLLNGDISVESFLSLLNNRGKVVVETRTGATTSNNRMIPIQVVREIAFAEKVESVSEENGINLSSITPGQLSTGFEMTLLPRVLNNLEILLHYNIRISDLNELKEFTSNDQTIQLPNVATTEFEQQTILGNGETLVLAGFERERFTSNQRKGGFLSRQARNESQKVATVILIRPRLLKRKTR